MCMTAKLITRILTLVDGLPMPVFGIKHMTKLILFDLDNTLLTGDSDFLWCDFLIDEGILNAKDFKIRNADMEERYKNGSVGLEEFSNFYVGTLVGRTPDAWESLRRKFMDKIIAPRIGAGALELLRQHTDAKELTLMTTATNRFITELTAAHLGIEHLIATEPEISNGVFTGKSVGTLNMREGKVLRLHEWMIARGHQLEDFETVFYSDSINDLPLLKIVNRAVAVDPDPRLRQEAQTRGWNIIHLKR